MESAHLHTHPTRSSVIGGDLTAEVAAEDEQMTGEAVALLLRPTGFVLRAAGAAIDAVLYILLLVCVIILVFSRSMSEFVTLISEKASIIGAIVLCLIVVPTAVEVATRGKSLGRLAVGARIVRNDGGSISFSHAFIRSVIGILEIFASLGGIAALSALLTPRSQRLGDLLAGTYSQNERISRHVPPLFAVPTELAAWSATADVARMPDSLTRRISQFLGQATRLTPDARARLSLELAREASGFVSPVPHANPELFLAAISVLRREREARALERERERLATLAPVLTRLPHDFPDR